MDNIKLKELLEYLIQQKKEVEEDMEKVKNSISIVSQGFYVGQATAFDRVIKFIEQQDK